MGAVDTTYTFTATDTITSTKMNNIIDQTTITGDAITGSTLEVVSGKLKVRSQNITSNELATNAVTGVKITSGSIDPTKLSTGYPSWTTTGNLTVRGASTALSSITTGTASVSLGSARTASGASNIDFNSAFPLTTYEARISRESGTNGNLVISNTGSGSIKFNDIPLGAQPGIAPIYGVRAWVNFNGAAPVVKSGTYLRTAGQSTATISIAGHQLLTGHHVYLDFAAGTVDNVYIVTRIDDNSFTITTTETTAQSGIVVDFEQIPITSSGNVSNVCKVASGKYMINFLIALADSNYIYNGSAIDNSTSLSDTICGRVGGGIKTNQSIEVSTVSSGASAVNVTEVCFSFIR